MRIAIIGAGPAGLTAAYQLAKAGFQPEVFEASSAVGGMARTISLWNQKVDLGPHRFFSTDSRVNRLWLEVTGNDYAIINRLTRIYYKGKFYAYPLKPLNAFQNLGLEETLMCLGSYAKAKIFPSAEDESLESWLTSRFGRRLFELFFKSYSEKLWGISCSSLESDFAAQRIKKLSLFESVKNVLHKQKTKHKTLVEQFAYPKGGTGIVYERMAHRIKELGGKVYCSRPAKRIVTREKKITGIEFQDGETRGYDHIVSTMPLTLLVKSLEVTPPDVQRAAADLTFRNTILVFLNINSDNLFPDQWIYIQSSDLKTGRITNFRNWVPDLYGHESSSIIAMEYWCNQDDSTWQMKDELLIEHAKSELIKIGLKGIKFTMPDKKRLVGQHQIEKQFPEPLKHEIMHAAILGGNVMRLPHCYPVYKKGYREKLGVIEDYLNIFKELTVIGRYGAFKYNNQDHSILMGILAAENIMECRQHDLWGINTDYEYQESSIITEMGLLEE